MKRWAPLLVFAVTVILCATFVFMIVWYHQWQSWAAYETGSRNTAGTPPNYNYWSGFGSVFPWGMGVLAGIWAFVYQHTKAKNCHTHRCWRIGSYPTAGGYIVCKRHHFEAVGNHPTIEHIRQHHLLHLRATRAQADKMRSE